MSKTMQLVFPLDELKLKAEPPLNVAPEAPELTRRIIGNMIYLYSGQHSGLNKQERAQVYWLQSALKKAVETKLTALEMPDDVCGFLRKVFRDVKADPDLILQRVEANIDGLADR